MGERWLLFFFQAEDGIRDYKVTEVQTCALPIFRPGDANAPESVHLASWPVPDPARADDVLRAEMELTRQVVEVGRALRKDNTIRTRQPLRRALVDVPGGLSAEVIAEIADELNVREVSLLADADAVMDVKVNANFLALGKRFGSRTQEVAKAITAADPAVL